MPLQLHNIRSSSALITALLEVDVSVLPRTCGRTTDQTETYLVTYLLAALASTDRLKFSLNVNHEDRPDILLNMAGEIVGIELTEAVSRPWAAFMALAEREKPQALSEMSHFGFEEPVRSLAQQRDLLNQNRLSGSGWLGDEPERQWANFIGAATEAKQHKLDRPGYRVFQRNWLAIYDNLPLHNVNLEEATQHLMVVIQKTWQETPTFSAIYISGSNNLLELTPKGRTIFNIRRFRAPPGTPRTPAPT